MDATYLYDGGEKITINKYDWCRVTAVCSHYDWLLYLTAGSSMLFCVCVSVCVCVEFQLICNIVPYYHVYVCTVHMRYVTTAVLSLATCIYSRLVYCMLTFY
jgi:hypothetical protein